ncbi:tRNA lysidine(34) synthetase TilS, partial [Hydrotalea sp.]|uniref:tRNA lysidine(34) synthetase TilS n=1 Tax=Hydrotalea sp. TaxID=2881279 RepID=UPI0026191726
MNLLQAFQQEWKKRFSYLHPHNCTLLLAVSGGVDSMVLLDLLHTMSFPISVAHVNFQLRGEESDRDERIVQEAAAKYQVNFFLKSVNTQQFAASEKVSIQVAARLLRYQWFHELLNHSFFTASANAVIVTAHHANDNIETVLHHFFRGTGIEGLQGIPSKNNQIIRPLLFAFKKDILAYAQQNGIQWVEDSSNATDHYTRNFIRLQLMPILQQQFPAIETVLTENIHRFTEATHLYQQAIQLHLKKLLLANKDGYQISIALLKKSIPFQTILWEIGKQFGGSSHQTKEIEKLLDAQNGSILLTLTHRFIKNRNWLLIQPLSTTVADLIAIPEFTQQVNFANGQLHFEQIPTPKNIQVAANILLADATDIQFHSVLGDDSSTSNLHITLDDKSYFLGSYAELQ